MLKNVVISLLVSSVVADDAVELIQSKLEKPAGNSYQDKSLLQDGRSLLSRRTVPYVAGQCVYGQKDQTCLDGCYRQCLKDAANTCCSKAEWFSDATECYDSPGTWCDIDGNAVADTRLYSQNFIDSSSVGKQLSTSTVGWTGSGGWVHGDSGIYVGPHVSQDATTPDGDGYYVRCYTGQSSSKYAVTSSGTQTITASESANGAAFTADWAASSNLGARFIVKIGDDWYGSEQFGMGSSDHGNMDADDVSSWETDQTVDTKSNWYKSLAGLPDGYEWRDDNQWDATPSSLPSGDITQFGIAWLTTANHHYVAVDNFRVTS
jgi:hypothetical protein